MRLGIGISFLVACLLMGAPVFGTAWSFIDPNEANPAIDGYDLKRITIDDHNGVGTFLTIEYEVYGPAFLIVDGTDYVNCTMWLNIGGFDQDPSIAPTLAGVAYDFEVRWYGDDAGVSGPTPYDMEFVVRGQDGSDMYVSGANTAAPVGSVLTLNVPWAQLVDTGGNEAVPGHTLLPPSFQFIVQHDNDHLAMADDIYPDTGEWQNVPEPLTMLGLFMGLGGVGAYIRRRRMA